MSDHWTPRVLDVEAQQADRKLFAVLHRATADAAEPLFLHRFEGFIAGGLAQEFTRQADTLRRFLLWPDESAPRAEGEHGAPGLTQELTLFLQEDVEGNAVTASDQALARQLAEEFAGAVWATIISSLVRTDAASPMVAPETLLPSDLHGGPDGLIKQVQTDTAHFEIAGSELNQVMISALTALLRENANDDTYLYLPRGMRIDREALRNHLDNLGVRAVDQEDAARYDAIRAERGFYRRNGW